MIERLNRELRCKVVRSRLPEMILDDGPSHAGDRAHIDVCLSCQAEAARYRSLRRGFAALRDDIEVAPPEIHQRIMAHLDDSNGVAQRRQIAVTVSAASALAVAAGVAIALKRRQVAA